MRGTAIFFLALFAVAAVGQMIACYVHNARWRRLNKPLVLASLLGFYLSATPQPDGLILAALLLSLAGDVLLLFRSLFKLGGLAFFGAHLCYIVAFSRGIVDGTVGGVQTALAAAAYSAAVIFCILFVKKGHDAREMLLASAYMIALGMMSCSALLRFWCIGTPGALAVFAGSVLFVLSDFAISIRTFRRDLQVPKIDFIVMATYAPAQFLIVLGMTGLI